MLIIRQMMITPKLIGPVKTAGLSSYHQLQPLEINILIFQLNSPLNIKNVVSLQQSIRSDPGAKLKVDGLSPKWSRLNESNDFTEPSLKPNKSIFKSKIYFNDFIYVFNLL